MKFRFILDAVARLMVFVALLFVCLFLWQQIKINKDLKERIEVLEAKK